MYTNMQGFMVTVLPYTNHPLPLSANDAVLNCIVAHSQTITCIYHLITRVLSPPDYAPRAAEALQVSRVPYAAANASRA